jgi:hypothetical protein
MSYQGSCHCGRIAFTVEGECTKVMECNCSHCSRKGYLLWMVDRDQLQITTNPDDMATYTFNKHVIQHHFCPVCGCAPFGFGTGPDGKAAAAVNMRCVPEFDHASVEHMFVDGRSF